MKKLIGVICLLLLLTSTAYSLEHTFLTSLTTPNSTEVLLTLENGEFLTDHTFQYTIAGISTNVVLKADGSLDKAFWFNLEAATTTKDANGTYKIVVSNTPLKYTKFTMVSESGATTATVDVKYLGK